MSLFAFVSAKHSPGATTAALALASAWGTEYGAALLAELDPAGGDLAARHGLGIDPGLAALASEGRRGDAALDLTAHSQLIAGGLPALLGPTSPAQAQGCLQWLDQRLATAMVGFAGAVFADCGRFQADSPATGVLRSAELTIVVMRSTLESVEHVRSRLDALESLGEVALLMVGDRPYPPPEIAAVLGVALLGVLADDARAARLLSSGADRSALRRTELMRSANAVVKTLRSRTCDVVGAGRD